MWHTYYERADQVTTDYFFYSGDKNEAVKVLKEKVFPDLIENLEMAEIPKKQIKRILNTVLNDLERKNKNEIFITENAEY